MKLWIARDRDGTLCLYKEKPRLDISYWYDHFCGLDGCVAELDTNNFPSVTFENSPQMVEVKLVE